MKKLNLLLICFCLFFSGCENSILKWNLPKLATVETFEPEKISNSSVNCSGNISNDGGASVTERGVCYNTDPNPTIQNNKVASGYGAGLFSVRIDGLIPNTNYYFKAYAITKNGISYGNETILKTGDLPVLTTTATTSVTTTTAITGGNATSGESSPILERGVCYSTSPNPTIAGSKVAGGSGSGSFSVNLSGLTQGTIYYIRAYATNSSGTAYGNELSFTTLSVLLPVLTTTAASSVTINSAITGGNITGDGGSAVTERGVCYSTSPNPTIAGSKVAGGSGSGSFSVNFSGLTQGTIYYIRAYATNSSGTAYGNELSFTTLSVLLPVLTTTAASSVTINSAITGGNITGDGGSAVTERGVCYSTSPNPTISANKITAGSGTGNYNNNITGLVPGTIYYVRAYAVNSAGTAYGNQITFTTLNIFLPAVTTLNATSVTENSAISGGNITSDGGGTIIQSGICFNTAPSPTVSDQKISSGSGSGTFSISLPGLSSGTTYYVRAYAVNSAGTAYGNEISFKTIAVIKIGYSLDGGIIFYVDQTGNHGLIAAPYDQTTNAKWGCSGSVVSGSDATSTGTGLQNTLAIVKGCSEEGTAARICYNLVLNGYDDWYLPSKDELNLMYINLKMKGSGGFADADYWSSSQYSDKNSWLQTFSSGRASDKNKNNNVYVRAIRSF